MYIFVAVNSPPLIVKKHLLKFYTEVLWDMNTDDLTHKEIKKALSKRRICSAFHSSGFAVAFRDADSEQS